MTLCVFQDWMFSSGLTLQMQSVLVLACRGPDGVGKFHPCKALVARYRATVLKAAYLGRPMQVDEYDDTTFMTLAQLSIPLVWNAICEEYFKVVDEIPHHYHMHIIHGAEIVGYKHPEKIFRERWLYFYEKACKDLHLYPESEVELDARLGDWDQGNWNEPELAHWFGLLD